MSSKGVKMLQHFLGVCSWQNYVPSWDAMVELRVVRVRVKVGVGEKAQPRFTSERRVRTRIRGDLEGGRGDWGGFWRFRGGMRGRCEEEWF